MLRKAVSVLLLIMMCFSVYAEETESDISYEIRNVEVRVIGITNRSLLKNLLDIDTQELQFATYEELETFCKEKRQQLINMRIFDDVSFEIEPTDIDGVYDIRFVVDDSVTTLVLPYGKYDSNYGAKLGFKFYDKNLLGTLSDISITANVSQTSQSWDTREYYSVVNWKKISLFGSTMALKSEFNALQSDDGLYSGSTSLSCLLTDLPVFGHEFSITGAFRMYQLESEDWKWGNGTTDVTLTWKKLPFFNHKLTIGASIGINQNGLTIDDNTYELSLSTTLHDVDMTVTDVNLLWGVSYNFTSDELAKNISELYFGVSDSFKLPLRTSFSTLSKFVIEPIEEEAYLSCSNTLSYNKINWKHNYRSGLNFSLSSSVEYDVDYFSAPPEKVPIYTTLNVTAFSILADVINIGGRFTGFYSTVNDYGVGVPAEKMRGILNVSFPDYAGKFGGILNTNITMTFLDIDGVAEVLVSPFADFGFFETDDADEGPMFFKYSGGLEATCIFDGYASYPFNVSVGADLEDVSRWLKEEIAFEDVEYEILISLNLFY